MRIQFERLIARSVVNLIRDELKLAGLKVTAENLLRVAIIGGIALFIIIPFTLVLVFNLNTVLAALVGFVTAGVYEIMFYAVMELKVEQRKNFMEGILPEYLQIVAANIRSGIAIDKAIVQAARPEFLYFTDDVKTINKELYAAVTLQNALLDLGKRYRSFQLQHTVRMITEAVQYGGGMTDLLNQIAKDLRNQQIIEKEISGQLFLYTIFIAFACLVGAPVLYALTAQMITITDTVWAGILKQNPGGLPTTGVSFLRPSPPTITIPVYHDFALTAVIMITGFGAFIVSVISSGSIVKGIRYVAFFILIGLAIFFIVSSVISGIFGSISAGA